MCRVGGRFFALGMVSLLGLLRVQKRCRLGQNHTLNVPGIGGLCGHAGRPARSGLLLPTLELPVHVLGAAQLTGLKQRVARRQSDTPRRAPRRQDRPGRPGGPQTGAHPGGRGLAQLAQKGRGLLPLLSLVRRPVVLARLVVRPALGKRGVLGPPETPLRLTRKRHG